MKQNIFFIINTPNVKPVMKFNMTSDIDDKIIKYQKNLSKLNNTIERYRKLPLNIKDKNLINVYDMLESRLFYDNYFNVDINKSYLIRAEYDDKFDKYMFYLYDWSYKLISNNLEHYKGKKSNYVFQNQYSSSMYKKLKGISMCDKENFLIKYYLKTFLYLFNALEDGGVLYFDLNSYCNPLTIEYIYILSYLFKKLYFINPYSIYCVGFLGKKSKITKNDIIKCIKNKEFSIMNKKNLKELLFYINNSVKIIGKKYDLIYKKEYEKYINIKILDLYDVVKLKDNVISLNFYIKTILQYNCYLLNNKIIKLNNSIGVNDIDFLKLYLKNISLNNSLLIGMTNPIILFTLLINQKKKHKKVEIISDTIINSIDLLKSIKYISNLYEIKYGNYSLELVKQIERSTNYYDFIYIDGYEKKYKNVDFVYASILLKKNGIIMISNTFDLNIQKYDETYFLYNTQFEKIPFTHQFLCYKKIS